MPEKMLAVEVDGQPIPNQTPDGQFTRGMRDLDDLALYEYTKIGTNCIRLFELFPGQGQDRVEGALHEFVLTSAHGKYDAVSYAWGDPSEKHTIVCNALGIRVTANLYRALLRLRKTDTCVMLWLDGICIDQGQSAASLLERSQQVAQMSAIYAKASWVVVDLGEPDQDFSYLIDKLEQYAKIDPRPTQHMLTGPINLSGSGCADLEDSQLWVQLIQFLRLSWFSRLWCFQEFVLASRVVTMCGSRLISDFDIHLGITRALYRFQLSMIEVLLPAVVKEAWIDLASVQRIHATIFRKQVIRDERLGNQQMSWEASMVVGRSLEVSDSRDRIYALYALLPEEVVADFTVDYTETIEAFQTRITVHLIRQNYGIWVLMHTCGPSHSQPSWIASLYSNSQNSWKQEQIAMTAGSLENFDNSPDPVLWRAGGPSTHTLTLGTATHELHTQGYVFDHISTMSAKLLPTDTHDMAQSVNVLYQWIADVTQWSQSVGIPEDLLWRVLIFDGYGELRMDPRYSDVDQRNAAVASYSQHLKQFLLSEWKDVDSLLLARPLLHWIATVMQNMCVAMTDDGIVAVVPYTTAIRDRIAILTGVNAPFIFRPSSDKYQLVGPCYLHGLMDGQMLDREDWNPGPLTII